MEKNVLKIGELASRTGLTVRALHHYDNIGLLTPSARADSGYRLYNRADVARLHRIQALRKFGMSLADIATFLDSEDAPFADIVAQQIDALDKQIEQASALRGHLARLQQQMAGEDDPALEDWLDSLEQMKLYEQYFTPEELRRLPFWQQEARRNARWRAMVGEAQAMMARGVAADSEEARRLSQRWMESLEHDTGANPEFAWRMSAMLENEELAGRRTVVPVEVKEYIGEAFNAHKMALYAKYLNEEEMRHLRANSRKQVNEWLKLFMRLHQHMQQGVPPEHPLSQALAQEWMTLFRARASDSAQVQARIRHAHDNEPELLRGTWVTPAIIAYIRQAVAACSAA